jgi:hypothetical protein
MIVTAILGEMSVPGVKRTLQVAAVDATTLGPVDALTSVVATCEKDASDGGKDGFRRPGDCQPAVLSGHSR